MVMKKIMLIALFLATGTAHANDQLPEAMLGTWCRNQLADWYDTYVRGECDEEDGADTDQAIIIYSDHYIEPHYFDGSCVFEKIELGHVSNTFQLHGTRPASDRRSSNH
jgi:hypothetical protein